MNYRVVLTSRAERQLYEAALWWSEERDSDQAARWVEGFEAALARLETNPQRHSLAREDGQFPFQLRNLLYGVSSKPTHRAVFEVRGEEVIVHAIRHVAQRDLSPNDLK